ncbi:hypothetical protein ACVW0K_007271 [Streptomyces filamentosus]
MTTDTTPALPLDTSSRACAACGLPGDLRKTPHGALVLLEHNDPVAPLTAADIPARYRWAPDGHFDVIRLPEDAGPEAACQVEHQLVCPAGDRDLPLPSARLRERRRLNMDRRQCARDLYDDGPGA